MTSPSAATAVRLIFEYEGDQVRLVHQAPVDVAVTGFDAPAERLPGNHVEVRSATAKTLSRVPIRADMGASMEVFPEDPQQPIVRTDLPVARGAFTVVVPVNSVADHVAVVRVAAKPGVAEALAAAGPPAGRLPAHEVVELARFPLARGGVR